MYKRGWSSLMRKQFAKAYLAREGPLLFVLLLTVQKKQNYIKHLTLRLTYGILYI